MIQTIVFDLGNVLISVEPERHLNEFLENIQRRPAEDVLSFIYQSDTMLAFEKGQIKGRKFFTWMQETFAMTLTYEQFKPLFCDIFAPIKPMVRLLQLLKRDLRTAILSNTNALHIRQCERQFSWMSQLDARLYSYDLEMVKPDVSIFKETLRILDASPAHTLFLDDRLENVEAAKTAGYCAYQFDPRSCTVVIGPHRRRSAIDFFKQLNLIEG